MQPARRKRGIRSTYMSDAIGPKGDDFSNEQTELTEASRPSRLRLVLLILLILAAAGGFITWRYFSVRESTDDAQIEGHVHPMAARVGGTVVNIAGNDNQWVDARAVLVQL